MSQHLVPANALGTAGILDQAGTWLLESGIQEPGGGVARYYLADKRENRAVSTEITGYAVSTFTYLYSLTDNPRYLDAAQRAATFLTQTAWNREIRLFPFEIEGRENDRLAYFFDCGIIVRGLLSLWRVTGDGELLDIARQCGRSMASNFRAGESEYHPVLRLPDMTPLARIDQWSRLPGCYQLKSALAWDDLYKATGEADYLNWYEELLSESLRTHESFLPGVEGPRIMDRLHAYCYFLEAILPRADRVEVAWALVGGMERVSHYLREIGPVFERSDVWAQLLRLRLLVDRAGVAAADRLKAANEAEALASFQHEHTDQRIRGGFYFAKRGNQLQPHVNPVSTGFALQALAMWRQYLGGELAFSAEILI